MIFCTTCGHVEGRCCRWNEIRRLDFEAACWRIDKRNATIRDLRKRLQEARIELDGRVYVTERARSLLDLRKKPKKR